MNKRRPIEIGWVVVGTLTVRDRAALASAQEMMVQTLQAAFPAFDWQMTTEHRHDPSPTGRAEPVELLDLGVQARDRQAWDFAFVVTGRDLTSYYKPFALGTPSRPLSTALLSLMRLSASDGSWEHPEAGGGASDPADARLARRVAALAMHLFGHLNDLPHTDEVTDYMFDVRQVDDLDRMTYFGIEHTAQLQDALESAADVRLEELGTLRRDAVAFYIRVLRHNRRDIIEAIRDIRPWAFPIRLSRLTTAAASTMIVLLITAEAWDLGMSQPGGRVLVLSCAALLATSVFIIKRQAILVRRGTSSLREQIAVGNIAAVVAVFLGMATMYALLFATTLALSQYLFSSTLAAAWAASLGTAPRLPHYFILAGFVAALGIAIGALGASFEEQAYFRHVTLVDEET